MADRFVKENVTVKPNRGNIISSDGKLMASSLPEYRIYMDFMSGEKDEKRRQKDQARRDSILNANMDSICIGLHKIFPDKSAAQFKAHLKKGRQAKSRNYLIYPKRISYIQYKEVKRLPVFCLNRYKGGFKEQATISVRNRSVHWLPVHWEMCMQTQPKEREMVSNLLSTPS